MPHIPAIVAQIARAADQAAGSCGASSGLAATSLGSAQTTDRIPLSLRTSHELWARSSELGRMAATARTADARIALETLAGRFASLAAKRETDEELELKDQGADRR